MRKRLMAVFLVVVALTLGLVPPTPVVAAVPLFSDDFESYTPGTYPGGAGLVGWQYVSGTPSIVTDTIGGGTTKVLGIVGGSYVGEAVAVAGSSTWQDYTLDLDVKKHSGSYFNIVFRYVNTGTYYLVEPSADTTHIALFKRVSGVFTELATPRPLQPTVTGTWYHYTIGVCTTPTGTNIKVFVDGVKKFDVTDNTGALAKGSVGVGGYAGSEGRFDNIIVAVTAGSITIDSDAQYTNSTSVILNLTATNAAGVTGYRVASGMDASGASTVAVSSTTNFSANIPWSLSAGDGTKTVAVQYRDAALNWSPNYTDTITLDQTPPVVTINVPTSGAVYLLNAVVLADWTAVDALSWIASASGTVPSGSAIDTGTAGEKTFTVTATDNAGNTTLETVTYSVVGYGFIGFLPPVDNLPTFNVVKAGRTIPVKWQLKDADGAFISDLSAVKYNPLRYRQIACDASSPQDLLPGDTSGSSGLRYDSITNQYIFTWQTSSAFAGKCYELLLELNDGTQQTARFKFTK